MGCDRIATSGPTYGSPGNTFPLRCFPENYLVANPQLQVAGATTGGFYRTNSASANYHSMEAQFTLRPTEGFSAQTTYTWSKTMSTPGAGSANPLDRKASYARAFSSVSHDLRTNGVIELPIGPNKLLFANSSGWLARVTERWQAGVILNLSSGTPTSITALGGLTYGTTVPDVVGPWSVRSWHREMGRRKQCWNLFWRSQPRHLGRGSAVRDLSELGCRDSAGGLQSAGYCREVTPGTPGAVTLNDGSNRTVQYLLVNPAPGKQGNLGLTTIEGLGVIRFDAISARHFESRRPNLSSFGLMRRMS
jgi:hypothetical protein